MRKLKDIFRKRNITPLPFFNSKKGSTAIFLTMILISMIAATFAFVHAAEEISEKSRNDAILRLAGNSILAEYSIPLKDRYGIFAFCGSESESQNKLHFYISHNCKETIFKNQITANLKEHCLMDVNIFESQVLTAAKYSMAADAIKKDASLGEKKSAQNITHNAAEATASGELNNGIIIAGLPSTGMSGNGISITSLANNGLPKLSDVMNAGTDNFLVNTYILNQFNHRKNDGFSMFSYFNNEVEYILYGKTSDTENARKFMSDFVKVRTGLNLIHIYSDPAKVKAIAELATLLTPGPEAAATQLVLAATWSYAEAKNDEKLLLDGKNVMAVKTKNGWALSLSGAVKGLFDGSMIVPADKSGQDYEDYLNIFLYLENREIKLLRMMDLIQINMKCQHDESFLIKEYNCGISYEAEIGGRSYAYIETYQ